MGLRKRAITTLIAGLALVGSAGGTLATPAPAPAPLSASDITAAAYVAEPEECVFLGLINDYRKSKGLGTLQISTTLAAAAEHHSNDMVIHNYFSHTLYDGTTWSQNIANHGYPTNTYRAENIAAGNASASATFTQWKNSPGHNANMLSSSAKVIGIGRVYGASATYRNYWTTTFGSFVDTVYTGCDGGSPKPAGPTRLSPVRGYHRSGSTTSEYAVDGIGSTAWKTNTSSTPTYSYVYFDLGAVKSLGRVKWYFSASGGADQYVVQVSNDRSKWTTISRQSNGVRGIWYSVSHKGDARYVRFYFYNPNQDPVLGNLAEVQFWG